MVTVLIIAILSAVAITAYGKYVRFSKLSESFSLLSEYRLKMEQLKQDTRSYAAPLDINACGVALPANKHFDFSCTVSALGTQFIATASNKSGVNMGNAADYSYSIDQAGVKNTLAFAGAPGPSGIWKNK